MPVSRWLNEMRISQSCAGKAAAVLDRPAGRARSGLARGLITVRWRFGLPEEVLDLGRRDVRDFERREVGYTVQPVNREPRIPARSRPAGRHRDDRCSLPRPLQLS